MITTLPPEALQQMLNALPIRIFWKDRESRYLGCNQLFADDAGVPDPKHFMGKTDFYLFPFHQAETYRYDDADVMLTGAPKLIEEQLTMPDGQVRWVETHKMPLRDSAGCVIGILGMYQHITERKRWQEHQRKEELAAAMR